MRVPKAWPPGRVDRQPPGGKRADVIVVDILLGRWGEDCRYEVKLCREIRERGTASFSRR